MVPSEFGGGRSVLEVESLGCRGFLQEVIDIGWRSSPFGFPFCFVFGARHGVVVGFLLC